MIKKGDTLIEVTLAIGIFSMVAIAVVSVMVSGTSNAQTALETTLAREEIDTQAEALRFIHAAYIADDESGENNDPYSKLWKLITKKENVYRPTNSNSDAAFIQYTPSSCQEIYDNADGGALGKGFVINPRALSTLTASDVSINKAYYKYSSHKSTFQPTSTYPRLLFNSGGEALVDNPNDVSDLTRVEGIYVLAVKDSDTTKIIGSNSNQSAYYDFYIRTCWYGMGSETPSTISTVIRLYDPEVLAN